jgi:hypothetical protein
MCNFSGRLIAWIDHELPEAEAVDAEQHVRQCAECRRAISLYQEISGAFLDCYVAATPGKSTRSPWRWAAVAGGLAAAILLASFLAQPQPETLPAPPPQAPHAPAIAFVKAPSRMLVVRTPHVPAPMPTRVQWSVAEPAIEVALPADALFPPGAVPAGFSFIAAVRTQP